MTKVLLMWLRNNFKSNNKSICGVKESRESEHKFLVLPNVRALDDD